MTRAHIRYDEQRAAPAFVGFDPDVPVAGLYRMRMRSGGVWCGVRIWFGQPKDPITGEMLDRSLRWQAEINGEYADLDRVWPKCAADPITEAEHRHLVATRDWAVQHLPDSALANPMRRLDPLTSPTLF